MVRRPRRLRSAAFAGERAAARAAEEAEEAEEEPGRKRSDEAMERWGKRGGQAVETWLVDEQVGA